MTKKISWLRRNWPMLPLVWVAVSVVVGVAVARSFFNGWAALFVSYAVAMVLVVFGFVMFVFFVRVYDWMKGRKRGRRR